MLLRFVLCTAISAVLTTLILGDDACKYTGSKGVIDISSLAGEDGKPKFSDVYPATSRNYSMYAPFILTIILS